MSTSRRTNRAGVALIAALVTLTIVSTLLVAIALQSTNARRQLDRRHDQLQAAWLAQSGIELAIARLASDPNYKGETLELVPHSQVRITVTTEDNKKPRVRIVSEARYPTNDRKPVQLTATVLR